MQPGSMQVCLAKADSRERRTEHDIKTVRGLIRALVARISCLVLDAAARRDLVWASARMMRAHTWLGRLGCSEEEGRPSLVSMMYAGTVVSFGVERARLTTCGTTFGV